MKQKEGLFISMHYSCDLTSFIYEFVISLFAHMLRTHTKNEKENWASFYFYNKAESLFISNLPSVPFAFIRLNLVINKAGSHRNISKPQGFFQTMLTLPIKPRQQSLRRNYFLTRMQSLPGGIWYRQRKGRLPQQTRFPHTLKWFIMVGGSTVYKTIV